MRITCIKDVDIAKDSHYRLLEEASTMIHVSLADISSTERTNLKATKMLL
ncbi:hypothetical protein Syun_017285 [Stephania yunnanensis]|uniref:Uncharacterized protein n=1 Tax=Stephania yunnanensis TaxID=152371 RepID=A0AAP0J6R8_9MAGN